MVLVLTASVHQEAQLELLIVAEHHLGFSLAAIGVHVHLFARVVGSEAIATELAKRVKDGHQCIATGGGCVVGCIAV